MSTSYFVQTAPHQQVRRNIPAYKQVMFAIVFFSLFLLTDGSSAASQHWEGALPRTCPRVSAVAVLLYGGVGYAPVVFISGLVAALLNYHRHFFAWCGLPGKLHYIWYAGAASNFEKTLAHRSSIAESSRRRALSIGLSRC